MYLANSVDNSDESVWLVVQRDQRCRVFELPPSGDKTVVFGASVDAHVKLPGGAPIALHVERDAIGIWLTPGYSDPELRVDGQPLGARRRMYGRAVVESPGVRLVLQVRDTPPTVRGGSDRYDDTTLSDGVVERPAVSITDLSDTTVNPCMATSGSMENATREYSRDELAGLFPADKRPSFDTDTAEFNNWFDSNAVAGGLESLGLEQVSPSAQVEFPRTDTRLSASASHVEQQVPCFEEGGTKTEELNAYEIRKALERYRAEPNARSPASVPADPVNADAEPMVQPLEPQHTIALGPVVLPEPTKVQPATQPEQPHRQVPLALRDTAVLSNLQQRPSGDTTAYDGTALRQLLSQQEQPTVMVPAENAMASLGAADEGQPTPVTPTATTTIQSQTTDCPVASKPTPSTLPLMTRLGVLAKEKPLHVLAGATFGSLFLVVFMVGAANLVSGGQKAKAEQASMPSLSSNAIPRQAPAPQASTVAGVPPVPTFAPAAPATIATPTAVADNAAVATDEAIDPSIQVAVGHLFAGRSAEAEQAYRELAAKHPDNASYVTLAKVLARRNSPDCRSAADSKKSCPKVKP